MLRLLGHTGPLSIDHLGLSDRNLHALKAIAEKPYGLILCVGPTGAGKTTSLHAMLAHLNTGVRKIWTAEDPVEISQDGLRQVQVRPKIGYTFAAALRHPLVARFKVMAGLDLAERRRPQDGKIRLRTTGQGEIELRVATVPTVGGN